MNIRLGILVIGMMHLVLAQTIASGKETPPARTVAETIECSMIRVSELLYILENSGRTAQDEKIRSWIASRIELQLKLMELAKLNEKQRRFVGDARRRLTAQQ